MLIFLVQVIILFIAKQIATRDLGNMTIICAKFYKKFSMKKSYLSIILRFVMEGLVELLIGALFQFEVTFKVD